VKTAALLLLFTLAVIILWRLNTARKPPLLFDGESLHIHHAACSIDLPSTGAERFAADVIAIERHTLRLPDGATVLYEWVDFPLTYDFAYPADAIVAKIFGFAGYRTKGVGRNLQLVRGEDREGREFSVLVVSEGRHRLELLYPLDDRTSDMLEACLSDGRKREVPKRGNTADPTIRPHWSEADIITEHMIEKDM